MNTNASNLDAVLESLRQRVLDDVRLRAEFERTRATFFADDAVRAAADREPGSPPDRRHLEWFLLEHRAGGALGRPIERLLRDGESLDSQTVDALSESISGVFEVGEVEPGVGYRLTDLLNPSEHAVADPERSTRVAPGDLFVGRVFGGSEGRRVASTAGAFFRDAALRGAVHADLERARARSRTALRIEQREIEKMFFVAEIADPVGAARAALASAGLDEPAIERIFAALRRSPPRSGHVPYDRHDALGAELDRLAFDTAVDLDVVRRALLAAWPRLAAPATTRAPRTETTEIEDALAEFSAGESRGEPLDKLLTDLESRLGLASDDDPDALEPAPDFPGVVAALVEEFLWESERDRRPLAARASELLRCFGEHTKSIGVFENLRPRDVLEFACRWLPEMGKLASTDEAIAAVDSLQRFCAWADEAHDAELCEPVRPALQRLRSTLPRITAANGVIHTELDAETGELFECTDALDGGFLRVRDSRGGLHAPRVDAQLAPHLRPGDRLRGRIDSEGTLRVLRCYPPAADEVPAS